MRNIWLVIKREIKTTLRKRSFWVLTFLMPVILLGFNTYYMIQDNELGAAGGDDEEGDAGPDIELPVVALVDEAGLIAAIPPDFPPDVFLPFASETAARAALDKGEVDQYVVIPSDYIATGEIDIYDREFQILREGNNGVAFGSAHEWMLSYLLTLNIAGDEQLAAAITNPTPAFLAKQHVVNPPEERGGNDQALARLVATWMPYIYYFILIITSGFMLQSVTAEKENRTVELLLLSLSPRQLMVGKILGLTVVVLIQIVAWLGGGVLAVGRSADWLNVSQFTFPPGFFIWAVLFLVLGYLLYASAMAATGAIANSAREGNQITWLLIIPLMPTLMFGSQFLENPHGTLSLVLSLFPFSAPSAMVTRLAVTDVPFWQLIVSLAGLALTAYLMVTLAARFFRPQNLLSQASFNWRRLATGWRKEA